MNVTPFLNKEDYLKSMQKADDKVFYYQNKKNEAIILEEPKNLRKNLEGRGRLKRNRRVYEIKSTKKRRKSIEPRNKDDTSEK